MLAAPSVVRKTLISLTETPCVNIKKMENKQDLTTIAIIVENSLFHRGKRTERTYEKLSCPVAADLCSYSNE